MDINVAAIRDLLVPGLRGVTGEYKQWPAIWPKLFDQGKSEMAQERTASMRFLPLAQLKTDGGQTPFDNNSGEAFVYNQLHVGIGLGYAIMMAQQALKPALMLAILLWIGILGFALNKALVMTQQRFYGYANMTGAPT